MAVEIECGTEVSDELAEAFARLMPQLSPRLGALSREAMERVVCSDGAALFAARLDGRIAGVLKKLGFDLTPPVDVKRLLKEVGKDKKNEDGMLRIVVPIGIGDCDVRPMKMDAFAALF